MAERYDVVVVGAGAAGLMAAAVAGQRGRRVRVLEHSQTIGAKILISGGGRCNFTNSDVRPDRFLSASPAFARSALSRYTAADFTALVARHGIAYYEKTLGQLFCEGAGAAKKIVAMLLAEASAAGAQVQTGVSVHSLEPGPPVRLGTSAGDLTADLVIIATGGLSIPKLGATDFAFRLAEQLDIPLVPLRPALVPLTFAGRDLDFMAPLAGVAMPVEARAGSARFREAALFTHRGLSGPAILQISSYWQPGQDITLDLAPQEDLGAWLIARKADRPKAGLDTVLAERWPARLAQSLATVHAPPQIMADQKDKTLRDLGRHLSNWTLTPQGDEGYAKAEVTAGGISTTALDQKTMRLKALPQIAFIGECVDITGWLGGYNFQWAWSSGWAAGMGA
jgi:hypothetical protein